MKYKNIIIILSLILFIFSSCSSLRKSIDNADRVILDHSNFKLIEGKYSVKAIDKKGSFDLDLYIFGNNYKYIFNDTNNSDSSHYIGLEVINEKTLNISYMEKNSIKTREVKGKLKNGYFVLKRSHLFIPIIFTNFYRNRQFRIGLLNNGNLITDYNGISFGTVMIVFPFYDNLKDFDIEFRRIQSE